MNIVMIHSGALNPNSGGGIHTLELLKKLSVKNKVICFTTKSNKYENKYNNIVSVPIIHFPLFTLLSYNIMLFLYLLVHCKRHRQDILYVRKNSLNPSSILISKIFAIPIVFEVNGILIDDNRSLTDRQNVPMERLLSAVESFEYKKSNKIIAVTNGIKSEIITQYDISDNKIEVIENGTNEAIFKPIDRDEALDKLGLTRSAKYVCFVGGLAPWHGVEFLILAIPSIIEQFKDTIFLIVGDGPERTNLTNMVIKMNLTEHVTFIGNVKNELVPYYINVSELCVAPFTIKRNSKIGLSPLKIYDYLACGKYTVASDIPGVRETIVNSCGGGLVEADNPELLGRAIVEKLSDKNELIVESKYTRDYIVANHTWSMVAKKTEILLENLLTTTK